MNVVPRWQLIARVAYRVVLGQGLIVAFVGSDEEVPSIDLEVLVGHRGVAEHVVLHTGKEKEKEKGESRK